jgi:hypothetical protein
MYSLEKARSDEHCCRAGKCLYETSISVAEAAQRRYDAKTSHGRAAFLQ